MQKKVPMYIIKNILLCLACLALHTAQAQDVPTPAPAQPEPILIVNATIHIGDGTTIEKGVLGFDKGKIVLLQAADSLNTSNYEFKNIIDATNQHIYPSLIACNTILGLNEIDAARPTRDYYETGDYNPNARSLIAYNTDSRITPTVRTNGILLAQIVPQGNIITGSSSVVQLDAWNWQDAAYKADEGIWLNFPSSFSYDWEAKATKPNKNFEAEITELNHYFDQARTYQETDQSASYNSRFAAMKGLFDRSQTLYINANNAKEIMAAVLFAQTQNLKLCLVGATECYKTIEILQKNKVSVMLNGTHSLPQTDDSDIKQPYKTPKILQDAGINYTITINDSWKIRNLPFEAGTAAAYGVTKEQALQAITLNAAKILGIDAQTGSLKVGKDANFFVSKGDALDMQTNQITQAYIQGRAISLRNKQTELYEKFKAKYEKN